MSDDASSEVYSVKSSKIVYKRSRSRPSVAGGETAVHASHVPKMVVTSSDEERESSAYRPVTKWAVDYSNKNFIRSQCHKNIGLHRNVQSRPLKYRIEYDNNYHVRSKVNAPKGLYKKKFEIKRKYAPDRDHLADATGWEFDWGPEIDQKEQDVPYIPEGRIVARGCYRWHGVKRNEADCDVKQEEYRENLLNEDLLKELKTGQEFLQADIPYIEEGKCIRGAYRCCEAQRNMHDIEPELPSFARDPEWKRKYHCNGIHSLDLDRKNYEEDMGISDLRIVKGKPFKRTVLNKVYEMRKEVDPRDSRPSRRHGTRLSFVPGEGEKTLHEGVPDSFPFKARESPSIRSVFKKKTERYRSQEGSDYEEYERQDTEETRGELTSSKEEKPQIMAAESRRSPIKSTYDRDEDKLAAPSTGYTFRAEANLDVGSSGPNSRDIESRTGGRKTPQSFNEPEKSRHLPDSISNQERDVRDEYETWRDNVENTRRERERTFHPSSSQRERKRSESFRNYNMGVRHKSDVKMSERRPEGKYTEKLHTERRKFRSPPNTRGPRISRYDEDDGRAQYQDEHEDRRSKRNRTISSLRTRDRDVKEMRTRKDEARNKIPPHVKNRIREIENKIEKKLERMNNKHKQKRSDLSMSSSSEDIIDFDKHKCHPKDRGHTHSSDYEKYITENGSEIWVKKEEKYAELHHKHIH